MKMSVPPAHKACEPGNHPAAESDSMITRVDIKNFKAIESASVELTPIHLLIGPNDSGKTSV
ncbi:MAG: AAA family ATPase, partial [Planctomycetales bacterium]|nr:AAA family ATPase [Planctomycetales bacterium]